jgi:SpoIIAA-like
MAAKIEVWLDGGGQFIRQRVTGAMDAADFRRLDDETHALVQKLPDPHRVRILADAGSLGHATREARVAMLAPLLRPHLDRLATFGMSPFARVMMRLLLLNAGIDKVRTFKKEQEAIAWLLS